MPLSSRLFLSGALFLIASMPLHAQVSGRVSGTILDPSGDVIVDADVTIVNRGTEERIA